MKATYRHMKIVPFILVVFTVMLVCYPFTLASAEPTPLPTGLTQEPTEFITQTPEATPTLRVAPPASTSGYINPWDVRSFQDKISDIPYWVYVALIIAFFLILVYMIIQKVIERRL